MRPGITSRSLDVLCAIAAHWRVYGEAPRLVTLERRGPLAGRDAASHVSRLRHANLLAPWPSPLHLTWRGEQLLRGEL